MQKLQGIAVSPGVAIGEVLVMDNEGFRIPRRFLPRDAVEDELERLDEAIAAASCRDRAQSRSAWPRSWARITAPIFSAHLQMLQRSGAARRAGGDDPPAALFARVFGQPRAAALRQGHSDRSTASYMPSGRPISSISRSGCCGTCSASGARSCRTSLAEVLVLAHNAHAQRDGESESEVRAGLRHRNRRRRQPHGDRRRRRWKFRPSSASGRF